MRATRSYAGLACLAAEKVTITKWTVRVARMEAADKSVIRLKNKPSGETPLRPRTNQKCTDICCPQTFEMAQEIKGSGTVRILGDAKYTRRPLGTGRVMFMPRLLSRHKGKA